MNTPHHEASFSKQRSDSLQKSMKVALVHDWTIHMRGGEKVLDAFAELFPDAIIYTLFFDRSKLSPRLQQMEIRASFLQWIPGIRKFYRWLLPFFPFAIRCLKVDSDSELVLSSSHCVAKGIRIPSGAVHVCYCHTPMRYAWVAENVYFEKFPAPLKALISLIMRWLRQWDRSVNESVDTFIANSAYIRDRIKMCYQRDACVVHPPYEDAFFYPSAAKDDYYFAISHFVPYKKIDVVIEAFTRMNSRLIVAGSGPLEQKYRELAKTENIRFVGSVTNEQLRDLYSAARAVIFPAEEDFGIVPVEAQACGTPVIAFGKGGALESVKSGVFFDEQTSAAIKKAVESFESSQVEFGDVPVAVSGFKRAAFLEKILAAVRQSMKDKNASSSTT